MKFAIKLIFLFLILNSACGQSEKPAAIVFPKPTGSVSDFSNIYSSAEEKVLDSIIRTFEKRTSMEIKILSLDSTMTTLEGFNSYILRLAGAWQVGKKEGKDNGVLIGISPSLQRVRITNGLGVEKSLTDMDTKRVLDDLMFPEFRNGSYFNGTRLGVEELIRVLEKQK
ncbi:TPM domain-containing protein [Paradesertivirga mongoliensis]|uniref:TPM domain-containing protein n=1 Tax=Paradesertivirga mongoliensis TaxID=2100740 RepID=A0ABW4ZPP9_9SPHI|nr:TPM domain-containing protein [Pedobacter mongoliensis]